MQEIGKILIFLGIILLTIGVFLLIFPKAPWLGKLPGDIYIQRKNISFYFPLATSIIASLILSLFFWLIWRR